jgi:hypothetical protein
VEDHWQGHNVNRRGRRQPAGTNGDTVMDGRASSLKATLEQMRLETIEVYNQRGQRLQVKNAYISLNRLIVDTEDV